MSKDFEAADVGSALDMAIQHQRAGRLEQAKEIYRKVLTVQPHNADALHLLGVAAFQAGEHEAAIELIDKAIRHNPENASFHNNRGEVYRALGQLAEAARCYQRALSLSPDHLDTHLNLANLMHEQGELTDAARYYRRALEIQPKLAQAHFGLANTLVAQDRADEAIESYRRALEIHQSFFEAHVNLGITLKGQGEFDAAMAHYRRALEIKPASPEALANLGNLLCDQGKFDEAIESYKGALELNPDLRQVRAAFDQALENRRRLREFGLAYAQAGQSKRAIGNVGRNPLCFAFPQNCNDDFKPLVAIDNLIDRPEAVKLLDIVKNFEVVSGSLTDEYRVNSNVRRSSIRWVERNADTYWIYRRMAERMMDINKQTWNFDLAGFVDDFQYTEYGPDGHYMWHVDIGSGKPSTRKLSFTLQLSDPDEYEGGNLEFQYGVEQAVAAPRTFGTAIVFPSFIVHRVSPVTKGLRRSLVGWASGTHPFR